MQNTKCNVPHAIQTTQWALFMLQKFWFYTNQIFFSACVDNITKPGSSLSDILCNYVTNDNANQSPKNRLSYVFVRLTEWDTATSNDMGIAGSTIRNSCQSTTKQLSVRIVL
jgi:hypothetical protein